MEVTRSSLKVGNSNFYGEREGQMQFLSRCQLDVQVFLCFFPTCLGQPRQVMYSTCVGCVYMGRCGSGSSLYSRLNPWLYHYNPVGMYCIYKPRLKVQDFYRHRKGWTHLSDQIVIYVFGNSVALSSPTKILKLLAIYRRQYNRCSQGYYKLSFLAPKLE